MSISPLQAIEVEPIQLPDPPSWQEGDDQVFEITIGEARQALYYKEIVPLLLEYGEDVREIAIATGEHLEGCRVKWLEEEEKKEFWRNGFFILSGGVVIAISSLLLLK